MGIVSTASHSISSFDSVHLFLVSSLIFIIQTSYLLVRAS